MLPPAIATHAALERLKDAERARRVSCYAWLLGCGLGQSVFPGSPSPRPVLLPRLDGGGDVSQQLAFPVYLARSRPGFVPWVRFWDKTGLDITAQEGSG
jgi:hypothetical protein